MRSVSDQDGELEVTTEVTPSCAKGDVLTSAANSIILYAPSSTTGGSRIKSGQLPHQEPANFHIYF